ncbi:MAG: DUF4215 domain-containing protein [Candidatus Peribacteraceae bacterium]|nr:DUF4215 domain-containing protein [Candidatus Peribacteraceae bacterium]
MKNTHLSRRFLRLVVVVIVAVIFLMIYFVAPRPNFPAVTDDNIPLPFGDSGTESLAGQLVTLGQKRGVTVRHVSFDNDEEFEVLRDDEEMHSMDFIVTPDSPTISHGAQLCNAVTAGKKYFGYKYTSRPATLEKERRDAAINLGAPSTLPALFPGEFFASAEMRSASSFIDDFETDANKNLDDGDTLFAFRDPCDVTLDRNARYVIKVMDSDVSFTARGIVVCGAGTSTACPEATKDLPGMLTGMQTGNVPRTYFVWGSGQVSETIYYDWTKGIQNFSPGIGPIDENVDLFSQDNFSATSEYTSIVLETANYSGSNNATYESVFTFTGAPANATEVTGARIRMAARLFDDMPDTSKVKLRGVDGSDLTDWRDMPAIGFSDAVITIDFTLLPDIPVQKWATVHMVFQNQWDGCGDNVCDFNRTILTLHAIDARFDAFCDGACASLSPVCGNGTTEGYIFEVCDDGNNDERDHCDNQCKRTGNWWIDPEENIPPPGIPGPLLTFDSATMTMGKHLALPSGRVVQLWYSGYASSATTNEHLYVSHYEPGVGWGEIVTINEGLGWVQAYGAQDVWIFGGDQEDLFVIFNTSTGSYRTSFVDGAWTVPILLSSNGITINDHATGTQDSFVIVYATSVSISEDLRNDPFFGPHLSGYTWDTGLFAQTFAGGQWSVPTMLQTLYHTEQWQQSVRNNPHVNVPRDTGEITGVSDDVFTIEWYGEEFIYGGAN